MMPSAEVSFVVRWLPGRGTDPRADGRCFVRSMSLAVATVLGGILLPSLASTAPPDTTETDEVRQLVLENTPWTGDFNAMLERRVIRVLAPYSRTLFFVDKGRERGLTAELARDFERYVNKKYAKQLQKRPVTVVLIPTTRDKLLTKVAEGLGDISAGNLTVTPDRQRT